jgi:Holliday junction resolvase RusA-like endonuclease
LSDAPYDADISLPFPIEFLIADTPRSHQSKNYEGKERCKLKVALAAKDHVSTLRDWVFLDERPLAATIFYFPPDKMGGDIDNIVKLILDGIKHVIYPEDSVIERVTVQKFEPDITWTFRALTPKLEEAAESEPPVIYIRIDDDLGWRSVT